MIRREITVLDNDILQLTHSTQKPEAITPQGQGETMKGFNLMTEHSRGNNKENLHFSSFAFLLAFMDKYLVPAGSYSSHGA